MASESEPDLCGCCGHERTYRDSNYWYCRRRPYWFWWRAALVVCWLRGCKLNCDYGDCYRCG